MARPPKFRSVEFEPRYTYFKPAAVPKWQLEEVVLTVEELEAIRLKDMEGLEQEECAERMHISRPTFQRSLINARKKIAESIVEGKAIRIEGGNYRLAKRVFKCDSCDNELEIRHRQEQDSDLLCPRCGGAIKKI
ncbi:MAG: DUF134 domain-containing protein [Clostridia bacterium]|nr:DUF134 domain-containing protein [Clostridia bacterium]MDD4048218.1 DUF134 domain-containing protein [Clostridia bacterium]